MMTYLKFFINVQRTLAYEGVLEIGCTSNFYLTGFNIVQNKVRNYSYVISYNMRFWIPRHPGKQNDR